ncbi:hypothetical protein STEG23_025545, partial [Scotinomys teguina]
SSRSTLHSHFKLQSSFSVIIVLHINISTALKSSSMGGALWWLHHPCGDVDWCGPVQDLY